VRAGDHLGKVDERFWEDLKDRAKTSDAAGLQRCRDNPAQGDGGAEHALSTKVRAADAILDHSAKAIELEDELRVAELEHAVGRKSEGDHPPASQTDLRGMTLELDAIPARHAGTAIPTQTGLRQPKLIWDFSRTNCSYTLG
jgi:hypothetical protein